MKYNDKDLLTMARTIWGEARGEKPGGQVAVAWVMRTRAQRHWGSPLIGKEGAVDRVCRQPWQFSCWNATDPNYGKILNLKPEEMPFQYSTATAVLTDQFSDPTHGADHYFAKSIPAPDWAYSMKKVADIGGHVFYNSMLHP